MNELESQIAQRLQRAGLVDQSQLQAVLDHISQHGGRLYVQVVKLGFAPEAQVAAALSELSHISQVDFSKLKVDPDAVARLSADFCIARLAFPCALRDGGQTLWLAMLDPLDTAGIEQARRLANVAQVRPLVALPSDLRRMIQHHYQTALTEANPFGDSAIDLSLSPQEEQEEFKITDMSGKTLVKHVGSVTIDKTAAPAIPARRPSGGAEPLAAPAAAVSAPPLTIEQRLDRMQQNLQRSSRIVTDLVKLFIEKGFFSAEEFRARMKD